MADKNAPDTQIVDISESLDEDAVSAMLDRTVAGKFRILRRLARGGMGVVYVAEHIALARKVVIKVLSVHLADDDRAKSRFEREARGLSVLDHPNVVTVHDFGLEKGLTYIVMEYVEGENLSQRVRRKGRIPYDVLLPIAMQTIDAIAAAHEKGIVHRDIKPSNVMVTSKGGMADFVKVLDFGLAKLATSSVDITKGNLVGTVSYLAPEVIKGGEALPVADVYSLGVMFYYLLAGTKPFQADDDMSVLYQHVNEEPRWLGELVPDGEVPVEFLEFVHLCMTKNPAHRPADAIEMRRLLAQAVTLPSLSGFSLDSAMALPRYAPPDSSAESVERARLSTPGVGLQAQSEVSRLSITDPSIALARPRRGVRVAVIAFTSFSVGLVALAALTRSNEEAPAAASAPGVATAPPAAAPAAPPVAPSNATLSLSSTPGALVAIDGTVRGRTPLELELEPGTHVVSVSEMGHRPWTKSLELRTGERRDVEIQLEPIAADAPVPAPRPVTRTAPTPVRTGATPTPEEAVAPPTEAAAPAAEAAPPAAEATTPKAPDDGASPLVPTAPRKGAGLLPVEESKSGLLPVQK